MEEFINKRSRNSSGRNSKTKWDIDPIFHHCNCWILHVIPTAPKTDVGTEVIKTNSEIQSVPESSTEKESSSISNLTPKDVQTLQELKEEIESNAPSDSNSLDINKAKDLAEKAQQQNWLKRGE